MANVKSILQLSLSPTTWSQYGKVWNEYESFARSILEILAALPILPFQAVLFFASLHQKGLAASTIRSAGSAISFLHKLQGMPDTIGSFSGHQVSSRTFKFNYHPRRPVADYKGDIVQNAPCLPSHGFQLIQNRSTKGFVPHNVSWLSSSGRSYFQVSSRFPHTVQRSHSQHPRCGSHSKTV